MAVKQMHLRKDPMEVRMLSSCPGCYNQRFCDYFFH
jgi:hypothetical protein